MTAGLQLGSPGVYFTPVRQVAELPEVHLDETGFVGIARRGPVNRAVKVTSWSDYVWWFGDVPTPDRGEPPTMLALAVQAYFAQGGRTAWVLRVAPAEPGEATAGFAAPGRPALRFDAANEGSWGNSLSIVLEFVASAEFVTRAVTEGQDWGFVCPDGVELPTHSLVRTRPVAIFGGATTAWVTGTRVGSSRSDGATCLVDRRLPVDAGELVSIAVITGRLRIGDGDPRGERSELFDQLGLRPGHVRFIPDVVGTGIDSLMDRNMRCRAKTVDRSSNLVTVPEPWTESILPDDQLRPLRFQRIRDGYDRWRQIDRRAFFDDASADADPLDEECHRGIDAIGRIEEIGLLCVPDLFWQRRQTEEPPPVDEITYGSGDFEPMQPTSLAASDRRGDHHGDVARPKDSLRSGRNRPAAASSGRRRAIAPSVRRPPRRPAGVDHTRDRPLARQFRQRLCSLLPPLAGGSRCRPAQHFSFRSAVGLRRRDHRRQGDPPRHTPRSR